MDCPVNKKELIVIKDQLCAAKSLVYGPNTSSWSRHCKVTETASNWRNIFKMDEISV